MRRRLSCVVCFIFLATAVECAQRIVSLAPHTTEWVYLLESEDKLVAVSDHSDFPAAAKAFPSVASYHGVNFEQIMRLQPDLILAWQGNKPQDLARLKSLNFTLFISDPDSPEEIAEEIIQVGKLLDKSKLAKQVAENLQSQLSELRTKYETPTSRIQAQRGKRAFYYLWSSPLMTVGKQAWASQLLNICGAQNVFADSPVAYPQVSLEEVIRRQPDILIAALKIDQTSAEQFWQPMADLIDAPVIVVDPDRLHRFTPRLLDGLSELCDKLN